MTCSGATEDEPCYCDCHDPQSTDEDEQSTSNDLENETIPTACLENGCEDSSCAHCERVGLDLEKLCAKEDEDFAYSSDDEDDMEHEDSLELRGMLYEPYERGLLLACKQIRNGCLWIYHGNNSFSWRFLWYDYRSSLKGFEQWDRSIRPQDARLMTQLSFAGRHYHEEGIAVEVDIDLLDTPPYFSIVSTSPHSPDEAIDSIRSVLERDLVFKLWNMAASGRQPVSLIPQSIEDLGRTFTKYMTR